MADDAAERQEGTSDIRGGTELGNKRRRDPAKPSARVKARRRLIKQRNQMARSKGGN